MASVGTIKYKNGSSWIDVLHPVGSFYFSIEEISPSELFGGTWTQITNAVIRGGTDVDYVGADTCILTSSQMPSHNHHVTNNFPYGIIVADTFQNSGFGIYPRDIVSGSAGAWVHEQYNPISIKANGGGRHTLSCNAPSIAISGIVLRKTKRVIENA